MRSASQSYMWGVEGSSSTTPDASMNNRFDDADPSQSVHFPVASLYHPTVASSTNMSGKGAVPASLTPGTRHRGNSAGTVGHDLFFQSGSRRPPPNMLPSRSLPATHALPLTPPLPPPPVPTKAARSLSSPALPRAMRPPSPPPPLPVPRLPTMPTMTYPPPPDAFPQPTVSSVPPPPKLPAVPPPNTGEDDELERALKLSAETMQQQDRLASLEEEELARALAESARIAETVQEVSAPNVSSSSRRSSHSPGDSLQPNMAGPSDENGPLTASPRPLPQRVSRDLPDPPDAKERSANHSPATPQDMAQIQQFESDEALALRLAEEEIVALQASLPQHGGPPAEKEPIPPLAPRGNPPQPGAHAVSWDGSTPPPYEATVRTTSSPTQRPASTGSIPETQRLSSVDLLKPPIVKASGPGISRPVSLISLRPQVSSISTDSNDDASNPERAPTPRQYLEPELLTGLTMGFQPPSISIDAAPMSDHLPKVIALPYGGRGQPFHMQAPSWRHLLKLLARLSGVRIEPTVEAMAVVKTELTLRTVVQFVKVHHSSQEWRCVVYLSLDHPIPAEQAGRWRYTNGDVNTLPYSYSLSPLPALLRDGPDSSMAKSYTVPRTPQTPYPVLPIDLPSLAVYLQCVLRDSRRAYNDTSSGLRKLAKMVDQFYPSVVESSGVLGPESPDRVRMGDRFRIFMRKGRKGNKERGENEDMYELVTPFVPDEWGG